MFNIEQPVVWWYLHSFPPRHPKGPTRVNQGRLSHTWHWSTQPQNTSKVGLSHFRTSLTMVHAYINLNNVKWRFPEIELPLDHPCYCRIFHEINQPTVWKVPQSTQKKLHIFRRLYLYQPIVGGPPYTTLIYSKINGQDPKMKVL